jgi:2-keto-4-pentenoate hydratase/2-oxohepta-3-ene-1,7-dioic acid hydratase in catechol pathway
VALELENQQVETMKIIRYKSTDGDANRGILDGSRIYEFHGNIGDFGPGRYLVDLEDVELLAPSEPRTIIGAAMNYKETGQRPKEDEEPIFFLKATSTLCGPNSIVRNPFPCLKWWGEPELAVIIKEPLSNASVEEAKSSALGFTLANDITVENIDQRDHHLPRSKSVNHFCPLGPWIETEPVSSDSVVEGFQNGKVARSGMLKDQIWQWPRILSEVSKWLILKPWDVVLTGNPPDYMGGMTTSSPGMRYLEHGDTYTVQIANLGKLEITVECGLED